MKSFWKKYKNILCKSVAGIIFCIVLAGISMEAFNRIQISDGTAVSAAEGEGTVDNYKQVAVSTGGAITAYIDWDQQDLKLVSTLGDEYFYISDDKMKAWDEISAEKGVAYCDLSWITKEYTLNIKGDKDPTQTIAIQIAAPRTLKAKFAVENGDPKITLTVTETVDKKKVTTEINPASSNLVQWRKGTVGDWQSYSTLNLQRFLTKGATLNFRLVGEYNSTTAKGYLPSKVASVKVTKKANAPSVKIDGTKLTLGVKKGQEYIVVTDTTTGSISSVTDKSQATPLLSEIANKELGGDGYSSPLKAFYVKVRTAATDKKAASKWTVISYPSQRTASANSLTVKLPPTGTGATITNNTTYNIEYYVAPMDTIQSITQAEISSKTKWKTVKAQKTVDYKEKSVVVTSNTAIFFRYAEEKDVAKTPENEAQIASTVTIAKPS